MHEIDVNQDVLGVNNEVANENREIFKKHGIYVFNLMSSPGAGKTTLLEKTIAHFKDKYKIGVIEGDIQSDEDAKRIQNAGAIGFQINTYGACHLNASLIHNQLGRFDLEELDILIIENVGNLVCPAEFDLGEDDKVMILSVTEGDDKPKKYPVMFHNAKVMLINKIDLLPYTNFDVEKAIREAMKLNFDLKVYKISCRTGEGLSDWFEFVENRVKQIKSLFQK